MQGFLIKSLPVLRTLIRLPLIYDKKAIKTLGLEKCRFLNGTRDFC